MVKHRHHADADHDAQEKVGFEGLLLGFMAKKLLAHNGARPTSCHAKYQQCSFRYPAHPFTRRHFISAIQSQRQHIDQQKPYHHRIRGQKATDRSKD